MTNKDFYRACDAEANGLCGDEEAIKAYLKSIAFSMAHIADYYDKFFGDPKDNEEYIE